MTRRPRYHRTTYVPGKSQIPAVLWVSIGVVVALAFLWGAGYVLHTDNAALHAQESEPPRTAARPSLASTPSTSPRPHPSAPPTPTSSTRQLTPLVSESPRSIDLGPAYQVISVTDGDTIRVKYRGKNEPVRFIGIDAPETRHPNLPTQCFGREASTYVSTLLEGERDFLVRDGGQKDRDPYDRLLRFVYTADGTNVNQELVRQGYATFEPRYPINEPYREDLRRAQVVAQRDGLGLWGACSPN